MRSRFTGDAGPRRRGEAASADAPTGEGRTRGGCQKSRRSRSAISAGPTLAGKIEVRAHLRRGAARPGRRLGDEDERQLLDDRVWRSAAQSSKQVHVRERCRDHDEVGPLVAETPSAPAASSPSRPRSRRARAPAHGRPATRSRPVGPGRLFRDCLFAYQCSVPIAIARAPVMRRPCHPQKNARARPTHSEITATMRVWRVGQVMARVKVRHGRALRRQRRRRGPADGRGLPGLTSPVPPFTLYRVRPAPRPLPHVTSGERRAERLPLPAGPRRRLRGPRAAIATLGGSPTWGLGDRFHEVAGG